MFNTCALTRRRRHTHTHRRGLMRVLLLPLPLLRSRVNIFPILFCSVFVYCCFPCVHFFFCIPSHFFPIDVPVSRIANAWTRRIFIQNSQFGETYIIFWCDRRQTEKLSTPFMAMTLSSQNLLHFLANEALLFYFSMSFLPKCARVRAPH